MHKLDPNNPDELKQMLHAGMGRAIQFLLKQDITQYRDMILDECLHNYTYDLQCEDSRAHYLYQLLKASGEIDYYRDAILQALPEEEHAYITEQLLDFAVLFARDGNELAKTAIYEKLHHNNTDSLLIAESQIIELDGISGLIYCLEVIGSDPNLLESYHCGSIISFAEDIAGADNVQLALKEAARENSTVARILLHLEERSSGSIRDESGNEKNAECPVSETTTWEELNNKSELGWRDYNWSRIAPDSEFEKAALDLDHKADPEWLASHLQFFWERAFPLQPGVLIKLVDHHDETVATAALDALKIISHPDIHALFNRLIKKPELSYMAVGLLKNNYETGDYKAIKYILEHENDSDNLHELCLDILNLYHYNPIAEGMEPLFIVYEKGQCSICRKYCIEVIQTLCEPPDWMIEECKYDAHSGTRELAETLSVTHG